MAQHDYVIDNQSGSAFRSDLNNALSAIVSTNSGGSAPSTTYAYMVWADTTTGIRKMRNGANNAWINIGDLSGNVLVLDSNKNVGFGTSSPSSYNSSYDNAVIYQASGNTGLTIATNSTSRGGIAFADGTSGTDAYQGFIYYTHNTVPENSLVFGTNAVDRLWIGGGGRFAVTSVSSALSTGVFQTAASAGTSVALIEGRHSGTEGQSQTGTLCFTVLTNGNTQNTNNSYGAISDIKLKENIVDANSQWDDIKGVQVRNYNFKQGQTHTQIGVIAQEIEQVSPGLVTETPDRDASGVDLGTVTKSVNYSVLYMKAIKALQEAMERIETLEAKVAALEAA